MLITLYEPAEAAERGRGYVAWADPGDSILFPHVDSCCALALVLTNNRVVGGHVPVQWSKNEDPNAEANMLSIYDLMDITRRNHAGAGDVAWLIAVGPQTWEQPYALILQKFDPDFMLEFPTHRINTEHAARGVDVTITVSAGSVALEVADFQTKHKKNYVQPDALVSLFF